MRILCTLIAFLAFCTWAFAETPAATSARKRQEAVKSIEIVFSIEEIFEKDYLGKKLPADMLGKLTRPFPQTQLRAISTANKLILHNNQIRCTLVRTLFNLITGEAVERIDDSSSDGSLVRCFSHPLQNRTRLNGYGNISGVQHRNFIQAMHLYAYAANIRGVDSNFVFYSISDFSQTSKRVRIHGKMCDEYIYDKDAGTNRQVRAYFDPSERDALRRLQIYIGGIERERVEVLETRLFEPELDFPTTWCHIEFDNDGKIEVTRTMTLENLKFGGSYPQSIFELQFPIGLDFRDERSQETYLVRDDGSWMKTNGNRNDTGPEVIADSKSNWLQRNALWLSGIGFAIVTLGFVLGYLRRKRNSIRG